MEKGMGYRMEHAMEHGNWNMQWNMEIGTCNGTWKFEHAMEWNLFYFFIKAKTVLFPAAVCVATATEIWNRPMDIICSNTW